MIRDEEIKLIAECAVTDEKYNEFKEGIIWGAKWADKNPKFSKQEFIEKVRYWLEKHTYDDKYWTPDGEDLFIGNLIDELVKYLEE